jgi:hypothetical protein
LTQDEITQYRVAGLELDEELPSTTTTDFPHRACPDRSPGLWSKIENNAETDGEGEKAERKTHASYLRTQHMGVLTTILHRCLLEGDIARASRAWAMLLRAQVNGAGVDIRTTGYWGIGAELLIRGEEEKIKGKRGLDGKYEDNEGNESDSDFENSGEEESNGDKIETTPNGEDARERRWGSAIGLQKAKEYYERLILQYPYKRQFHSSVNALDFWPAMLGCEIYGVQFEQKEALATLATQEGEDDTPLSDISESEGEDENEITGNEEDRFFASQQRQEARQFERQRESVWEKRENIRHTALGATEKIAKRMDELMSLPPHSDSHVLHRLRGMLALYAGDLYVPTEILGIDENISENEDDTDVVGRRKRADRKSLYRQRLAERERGIAKRAEEIERARKSFEKISKEGGRIDDELVKLLSMNDRLDSEEREVTPAYT